jgi:FkbM family methyltransferase
LEPVNSGLLIFSPRLAQAIRGEPFVVLDAGARAGLDEPWSKVDRSNLRVIGFEPDPQECARLVAAGAAQDRFLPIALWSDAGGVRIHSATVPACSSVHPPNDVMLDRFGAEHAEPRRTREILSFPSTTLDAVLADESSCDFVKIDTQGAEFEILEGGRRALGSGKVFGVLVETWTTEIHTGQRLSGDIMVLLQSLGFSLFDVDVGGSWRRPVRGGSHLGGKAQVIVLNLLFLHEDPPTSPTAALKRAAIAEAFGFPEFGLQLLDDAAGTDWAVEELRRNGACRHRRLTRAATRLSGKRRFAPLH